VDLLHGGLFAVSIFAVVSLAAGGVKVLFPQAMLEVSHYACHHNQLPRYPQMVVSQTYSNRIERSGLISPLAKANVLGQTKGQFWQEK
jgi:hypothetical protein